MSEYAGRIGTTRRSGSNEEEVLVSDFEDDNENQRLNVLVMRAKQLELINDNNQYNNALLENI